MRVAALAVALVLLAQPALATLTEERIALDAEGTLLVGLAGVGIGKVDDDEPVPDLRLSPVSLAVHPFTLLACDVAVLFTLTYASWAPGDERAILQLELRTPEGAVLDQWLATDGHLEDGPDETPPPGDYALYLFHVAGGPVDYGLVAMAYQPTGCAA